MYVKRNQNGEIISISRMHDVEYSEQVSDDAPDLLQFLQGEKSAEQLALEQTDQTMARVLEDVINLLVDQGTIRFTDLPEAAQTKLLSRRELRGQRQGMNLLDDGDDLHL